MTADTDAITITEEYHLSKYREPVRLMLITTVPDALSRISYDNNQLSATVEDISDKLDPLLQGMWGKQMYRIVLTAKSKKTKNKLKYTIR